ncbi:MAG: flagellar FliJ family protein [Nitrospinales bacterium]
MEEKRKVLAEAVKRRKTLEILIEREQAELSEQLKKRESAAMDEAAAFQWIRKRQE